MNPQTILIADDNAQNRYLAKFLLEKKGYIVHEAEDGAQALTAITAHPPDLVLMDIQMPRLDGLEATRRLKASGWKMPVIAMTAKAMAGDREAILAAGCDGYIEKPIDPLTFVSKVETFLPQDHP